MATEAQHELVMDLLRREYTIDAELRLIRCNRCGEWVTWLTKHAVERHGDDIPVVERHRSHDPDRPEVW
jgi:hypothetical protein